MVLPSSSALAGPRQMVEYRATGLVPDRLTPQRAKALAALDGRQGTVRELAAHAEVSDAVLRGLVNARRARAGRGRRRRALPRPRPRLRPARAQRRTSRRRRLARPPRSARASTPCCSTESPGRARPKSISKPSPKRFAKAARALVLLPEIALTEPFLTRFTARFGCEPVAWHSDLRSSQRRRAWRAIASGEAKVVVGARSALFLPYANLGLIVVDEAHEPSFKQEEGVQYHARDVAVMRGHFEEIPVILSSATPAIETRHMVEIGRYRELLLTERHGAATMPTIRAHRPDAGPAAARPLARAEAGRRARRQPRRGRAVACCSSTAAASPR